MYFITYSNRFLLPRKIPLWYNATMKTKKNQNLSKNLKLHNTFLFILGLAFFLRLILAATSRGFDNDVACFSGWALRVFRGGFANFYSLDTFTDYPPGYIYVLYIIGAMLDKFQIDAFSGLGLILLRMPSLICDLVSGVLLYTAGTKYINKQTGTLFATAYLFNPAVILNSVVWGQVDSILALCVIALCLLLLNGKVVFAAFVFVAGLLFKPQMLIFAPLLLYGIYEHEIIGFTNWKKFLQDLFGGILSIACLFLGMMPFGVSNVIPQYTDTLSSYPYASVNAYNFWAMIGLNWNSQDGKFLGITYATWGTIAIVLLTILSAVIFELLRRKNRTDRYTLTGAFLIATTFLFSVRMHERYLYPVMILILFTTIYNHKKAYWWSYLIVTLAHFINVWHVLYHYDPGTYFDTEGVVISLSTIVVAGMSFFYVVLVKDLRGKIAKNWGVSKSDTKYGKNTKKGGSKNTKETFSLASLCKPLAPTPTEKGLGFTKVDFIIIAVISLVYAAITFTNLGYMDNPETEYAFPAGAEITLTFEDDNTPTKLAYFLKTETELTYELAYSSDGVIYTEPERLTMNNVFTWGQKDLTISQTHIRITNATEDGKIGEFIFLDETGNPVMPLNAKDYPELFDETDALPATFDFRSSAYFDEIYYHRTANEFIIGERTYENTHPPLGKIFMMIGALIFGTNPFGFRFAGALFGVLMLPFIYLLVRNLLKDRFMGAVAATLMAFDFMHFTQTRISTIDVFVVFFIILMYYFMERYLRFSFYDTDIKQTFIPLGACGVMFGLGIASKWTGLYAGAGLAILFFFSLYKRYMEYRYALKHPNEIVNGNSSKKIIQKFAPCAMKTIGFCILFFVVVPFTLYTLSYIPFREYGQTGLLTKMWNNQISMYNYHSNLTATHGYSSFWYEWPLMKRPVFYYSKILGDDMYQGISAFGNPAIWYPAIPAALYTFYRALYKKCNTARFLSIGLLAQFVPWTFVTRCTFLYHYFPSTPFLIAMICYALMRLRKYMKPKTFIILVSIYLLTTIVLFAMFYPVISGMPVSGAYVEKFLRWRNDWVLIYNY